MRVRMESYIYLVRVKISFGVVGLLLRQRDFTIAIINISIKRPISKLICISKRFVLLDKYIKANQTDNHTMPLHENSKLLQWVLRTIKY